MIVIKYWIYNLLSLTEKYFLEEEYKVISFNSLSIPAEPCNNMPGCCWRGKRNFQDRFAELGSEQREHDKECLEHKVRL